MAGKCKEMMSKIKQVIRLYKDGLDSEGVMTNPSANDIISMALDALIDGAYPKAKWFENK